jgi:hypothetical protein
MPNTVIARHLLHKYGTQAARPIRAILSRVAHPARGYLGDTPDPMFGVHNVRGVQSHLGAFVVVGRWSSLLPDPEDDLPTAVSRVQPLVALAHLFQRQHLVDQGAYLTPLD